MLSETELIEPFEAIPEELRLIHCVNIISSQPSDLVSTTNALNYLRFKATAQLDTEAKTKLCIIYNETSIPFIKHDPSEASLWSRSIFDKQLSQALAACSSILSSTDDLSLTHYIMQHASDTSDSTLLPPPALCYLSGLCFTKEIGFSQQLELGIALLKHAAVQGRVAEAGCELGRIYGDRYKYSLHRPLESMHYFQAAFECGSTQAVVDLAYGFFEGNTREVPKDDVRAFKYAKEGATLNDKYCQYIVGHLTLKGRGGVEKADAQEAVKWLHASAEQGFAVALEEEAAIYMYGHGNVKQDYTKARECCTCDLAENIPFCLARLGDLYRHGWGVEKDFQKAFEYYQKAASQSNAPYPYAQHMLGEMFFHGEGVPKDMAVAKEWFQIASTQGYEPAHSWLERIDVLEANVLQQQEIHTAGSNTEHQEKKSSRWSLNFFNKK